MDSIEQMEYRHFNQFTVKIPSNSKSNAYYSRYMH